MTSIVALAAMILGLSAAGANAAGWSRPGIAGSAADAAPRSIERIQSTSTESEMDAIRESLQQMREQMQETREAVRQSREAAERAADAAERAAAAAESAAAAARAAAEGR